MAVAQFDYPSQEAGDLPFSEGDKITILSKESDDWWKYVTRDTAIFAGYADKSLIVEDISMDARVSSLPVGPAIT